MDANQWNDVGDFLFGCQIEYSISVGTSLTPNAIKVSRDSIVQAFPDDQEEEAYASLLKIINETFTPITGHRFHYSGKTDDVLFLEII